MIPSTHNIRRPAFWLACTCLCSIAFFALTDPHMGLVRYEASAGGNAIDAVSQTQVGTWVGMAGSGVLLVVALFLCTRKGSPPVK